MLLILLSWLYIIAITAVVGISINRVLQLNQSHTVVTLFIGFFGVTLFTGFWAIAFSVNWQFHCVLFLVSAILFFINRSSIINYGVSIKVEYQKLNLFIKALFVSISLFILAQCASPPFIIDNESYYIQTIKWLNEYGFVKGLVNLHYFHWQTSGWHILQSAFNFSFLYERFNDLSGLALLLGNYFAFTKLNAYMTNKTKLKRYLIFGLFPVFNIFLFQFISAPSPDIAIYVLALLVFYYFIKCYSNFNRNTFIIVVLLSLFMTFIKLSSVLFCLFPFFIYVKHFALAKKTTLLVTLLGSITLVLFIIKNVIINGNPIFPLIGIDSLKTSWHLPNTIEIYFANYGKSHGYHLDPEGFENTSTYLRFKSWLFATGIHGIFNKLIILLLLIVPFILNKRDNKKAFWLIYLVALVNMVVLFVMSPQYRFFFPYIIMFGLMVLSLIIIHKKSIKVIITISVVIAGIPMFFNINNKQLTNNVNHQVSSKFSLDYLIQPSKNSKYKNTYNTIQVGNTKINTPTQEGLFWETGDLPLPALNVKHQEYFETYFKLIPQQNSDNLKDGFYYKKLK